MTRDRPKILLVDDAVHVGAAIARVLESGYEVTTSTDPCAALEVLTRNGPFSVVISDLEMPVLGGAAFLARVRAASPDTVRVLLTGVDDLAAGVVAVNQGQIFRFLTKPCFPDVLRAAIAAAIEQHRLITAERVLLEQTLNGAIHALVEVLSLVSPVSFGRAQRLSRLVTDLATELALPDRWQLEIAALLSELACVALPDEVSEKLYYQRPLTQREATMVARVPLVIEQLLGKLPRLEIIRELLRQFHGVEPRCTDPAIARAMEALRAARRFDALESRGDSPQRALSMMRSAKTAPGDVLDALARVRAIALSENNVSIALRDLAPGMRLVEDIKMANGTVLVSRGQYVTESYLERLRNYGPGAIAEPLCVVLAK